jgi:hypothetical protein
MTYDIKLFLTYYNLFYESDNMLISNNVIVEKLLKKIKVQTNMSRCIWLMKIIMKL